MAINSIEYNKVVQPRLDTQITQGATSGWMEANAGQVIYTGGNEIKMPEITTQGMGDYDRDNGYTKGAVSLKYRTYTMGQDRGQSFQLDNMDVDESNFLTTSANVLSDFQKEHVIPEIDKYRYSKLAMEGINAGQTEDYTVDGSTALKRLLEHLAALEDVLGSEQQFIITMGSLTRTALMDDPKIHKYLDVTSFSQGGITTKLKTIDGHIIKIAPQNRLKTKFVFRDGKTAGQEKGGVIDDATAKKINWIICPQNLPIAVSKTDKLKLFTPDQNQSADAYLMQYRKYHELWVINSKLKSMFVCTEKTEG